MRQAACERRRLASQARSPCDRRRNQASSQGLGFSGPIHGADGSGGLLAAVEEHDPKSSSDDENFWCFYDAEPVTRRATQSVGAAGPRAKPARRVKGNGNVGQLVKTVKDDKNTCQDDF
ncbi:MAG TPA: hypothetical protein PLL20_21760 [Phycisphaerae bacterium]|nr:hypothetical protein [Phycisphaerae bacterium]